MLVTGLNLLQLAIQFGLQLVLARQYGAGEAMDAYVAALAWPTVAAAILSGAVGYVLIPAVARQQTLGGPQQAALVGSQLGWYLLLVSLVVAGGTLVAADRLAALLCPGFPAAQQTRTAHLLRVLASLIVLNSLTSFLHALHHTQQRFARPALAGVAGTLTTLAWVLLTGARPRIETLAWAVVGGSLVTVSWLGPLWVRQLVQTGAWCKPLTPAARQALRLWLPLVAGGVCWRLDPLVDRWAGSYLAEGSLSHLGYAWRLVQALSQLGTSGLAIVVFPVIATQAAARQRDALARELAHGLRLLLVLVVPVCVGLGLFARPVVAFLFQRGAFHAADTQAVSWLVWAYLGSILGMGVGDLCSRTMYAGQNTHTPVVVHTLAFLLAAAGKVALVGWLGAGSIAAATTGMHLGQAAVLAALLRQQLGPAMLAGMLRCAGQTVACSLAGCLAAAPLVQLPSSWALPLAILAGGVTYGFCLWLTGNEFAIRAGHRLRTLRLGRAREEPIEP